MKSFFKVFAFIGKFLQWYSTAVPGGPPENSFPIPKFLSKYNLGNITHSSGTLNNYPPF